MRKSVGCVRSKIDLHLEIFHKEVLIIKIILLILVISVYCYFLAKHLIIYSINKLLTTNTLP
jgi:hypothetical protein